LSSIKELATDALNKNGTIAAEHNNNFLKYHPPLSNTSFAYWIDNVSFISTSGSHFA